MRSAEIKLKVVGCTGAGFRKTRLSSSDASAGADAIVLRVCETVSCTDRAPSTFCEHTGKCESLYMRVKSNLASYVTEQLAFLGRISNRAIFGGIGIFIDERLLGIVINESLYLHTDKSNIGDYLSRGMEQFKPYPNAFDLTTDHHRVPPEIVEDADMLRDWGQRSLTAAIESAKAKQLAGIERARKQKRAKKQERDKSGARKRKR